MAKGFDVWEFWERVKVAKNPDEHRVLLEEFAAMTEGKTLTHEELTVKIYLQPKAKKSTEGEYEFK